MKKTFVTISQLFSVLLLVIILAGELISQPQYYNYNTTSSSNSFPFNIPLGKEIQALFLAGDFNQPSPAPAGNITSVSFMMAANLGPYTYTNFTIRMGMTNITTFATGVWYTGQLDTVYYRASVQLTGTSGQWLTITLDRPFAYDPTQSLVIDVNQCTAAGATGFSQATTTLTNFRRNTSLVNTGCPFVWGQQSGTMPNMGISVAPPACNNVWTSQTSGTTNLLQAVSSVDRLIGWIAGASATVRRTTDGGVTWTNANPNPGVITGDIYSMFAIDANTCVLTTSPAATFMYRTSNGGTNWTQVFTQAGGFIDAISFVNATTGFAYGDPVSARWSLWKTTNGGINWDSTGLYLPQNAAEAGWNNAMKISGTNIWFGTNGTRIYHSTNFGANWTFGATGDANSYSIQFNSLTNGMGGGGVLNKTTNGGANYSTITAPGTGNLTSMSGGLGSNYYWYTRGNNVYKTTDAGSNWTTAYTGTQALWGMDFITVNGCPSGWAVGAAGTVLRMANDSLVGVSTNNNQMPTVYRLEQNYPNPFNPVTKISYSIPKAGYVELKVYDVLGKEVKTLVKEVEAAGNQYVMFDAAEFASGVYFYTLVVNDFRETKKMMLIK